jgi:TolB protein
MTAHVAPRSHALLLGVLLVACAAPAFASLEIPITHGVNAATPIAVVPFAREVAAPAGHLARVIADDLTRSGIFRTLPRRDLLQRPSRTAAINFLNWRALGMDYLLIGRLEADPHGGWRVLFRLFNVPAHRQIMAYVVRTGPGALHTAAHTISDLVFRRLTGVRGAFDTRIAFVASEPTPRGHRYLLIVSDYDGHDPRVVVRSHAPLLSPAWSPHGRRLAYVGYHAGQQVLYVQTLATGRRTIVTDRPGLDDTPAFSPGGRRLALTLTPPHGNAAVYLYDFAKGTMRRVTRSPNIATEPSWFPDGRRLAFTSDRGGSAQIYAKALPAGRAHRLTFHDGYNADPQVGPRGRHLVCVTRLGGALRLARLGLKGGWRLLTPGPLDDSPSLSPNGMMVVFTYLDGRKRALATAAVHGRAIVPIRLRLPPGTSVGTPAWGPWTSGSPSRSSP